MLIGLIAGATPGLLSAQPLAPSEPAPIARTTPAPAPPPVKQGAQLDMASLSAKVVRIRRMKTITGTGGYYSETADGSFVVITLEVTNRLNRSVRVGGIGTSLAALRIGGRRYTEDFQTASTALESSFLTQPNALPPGEMMTADVVFDIPTSKLNKKTDLKLGPLGHDVTDAAEQAGTIRLKKLR